MFLLHTRIANGAIRDGINLEAEFRSGGFNLSEHERAQLLSELEKREERVA